VNLANPENLVVGSPLLIAAALAAASAATPVSPRDNGALRSGTIVASNVYLLASPADSPAALIAAMRRLQQPQPILSFSAGAWRIHFAAWLERATGETSLELRFDAMPAAGRNQPPARVFSSAVPVDPASTTVVVNDFVISDEQGFAAGGSYEVSLWRVGSAEAKALAKGSFILE
jgi:hypothetical protein